MCRTLSRKMRESAMWRQYSRGAISRPPNAVPYGLYVQQRNEKSPSRPSRRHSSWKSRVRCRCSSRSSSVSSKPITIVAVVRIPLSTIARCASRYSADRVLPLRMPLAEVLGEDLAPAARDPVHARVAEARRRLGVGEPGAVGEVDELRHRQRVELDAVAVALAHRREEVAVEVERQLRVEAAVERDEVAADLEELVDLREHLLPVEHVAAVLVRQDVERAVVALGDADVRVVDDAHHHVRRAIRLVPARARRAGELAELVVASPRARGVRRRRRRSDSCRHGLLDRDLLRDRACP